MVKRLLLGRPLASAEQEHQRILKVVGLAVFSSDAISSTAYATEEILFVTAVGASSLALGLDTLFPIAIAVAVLLAIVVTSYRRTIFAYPGGGGSYIVSRENLGRTPSLVAGRVDPRRLHPHRRGVGLGRRRGDHLDPGVRGRGGSPVLLCLGFIALITSRNFRGIKESGRVFASRRTSTS